MTVTTCKGCNQPFVAKHPQQVYCNPHCAEKTCKRRAHKKQREKESTEPRTFIGVDGEGIYYPKGKSYELTEDRKGLKHDYVLLSVGDQPLKAEHGKRLTTLSIFTFLYDCFLKNPDAIYVGYYIGYDLAHWLKDLPIGRAKMLLTKEGITKRKRKASNGPPFPVHLATKDNQWAWEVDLLGTRRFKLRPGSGSPPGPNVTNLNKWMYVTDVGSFFQMSFMKTLEGIDSYEKEKGIERTFTDEEMEIIRKGKASRERSTELTDEMVTYNCLENELLARVMSQQDHGLTSIEIEGEPGGIRLQRQQWMGPGQAAQAWLKKIDAPSKEDYSTLMGLEKEKPNKNESIIRYAWDAARRSYFGGWFEVFRHGHVGDVWEYDINSAYPTIIAKLPCLLHGKWSRGKKNPPKPTSDRHYLLIHSKVIGSDELVGAMAHRSNKHQIFRPHSTSGWYWWHELQASINAGLINDYEVDEWVFYEGCDCPSPCRGIKDLYQMRISEQVGKNSPKGKSLKLIYNSGYGKFAQSIGEPRYANPIYASLIVTGCRVMILGAIATHPTRTKDLMMIATDGIYFRKRHPGLELSKSELGKWDESQKKGLTIMMPGLYWDDESRKRVRERLPVKLKSRGVSAAALAAFIFDIDEQFSRFKPGDEWPSVSVDIPFTFITPKQAIARNQWELCGRVPFNRKRSKETDKIIVDIKSLSADPKLKRWGPYIDSEGMVCTKPFGECGESTPYDKSFGYDGGLELGPTEDNYDWAEAIREVLQP